MVHPKQSKLRLLRRQSGLTQKEIAFLLGQRVHTLVSKHEHLKREPDLRLAFAYRLVFRASAHAIFDVIFNDVCRELAQRANVLAQKLRSGKGTPRTPYKLTKLDALAAIDRVSPPFMRVVLSVVPNSRGFAFVVLSLDGEALDWGVKDVRTRQPNTSEKAIEIARAHRADYLVMEDHETLGGRGRRRTAQFLQNLEREALASGLVVKKLHRNAVPLFLKINERSSTAVACAVAAAIPSLAVPIPRARRVWESEPYSMQIFKAGAFAMASGLFANEEDSRTGAPGHRASRSRETHSFSG